MNNRFMFANIHNAGWDIQNMFTEEHTKKRMNFLRALSDVIRVNVNIPVDVVLNRIGTIPDTFIDLPIMTVVYVLQEIITLSKITADVTEQNRYILDMVGSPVFFLRAFDYNAQMLETKRQEMKSAYKLILDQIIEYIQSEKNLYEKSLILDCSGSTRDHGQRRIYAYILNSIYNRRIPIGYHILFGSSTEAVSEEFARRNIIDYDLGGTNYTKCKEQMQKLDINDAVIFTDTLAPDTVRSLYTLYVIPENVKVTKKVNQDVKIIKVPMKLLDYLTDKDNHL